ncbi:MAG: trehalase-like domain-containing protein, partial [Actinomycetota bacterium]
MSATPIEDHALLSDCQSAALVDKWGSVEWWCLPRFDGPSVFGRILDEGAGHFSISLRGARASARRYLDSTLTLETTLQSDDGELVILDTLAMARGVRGHELGEGSPLRLVRSARCARGRVAVDIVFRPRFEYGLTIPSVQPLGGGVVARGGPATLVLSATVPLHIGEGEATAAVDLNA